MFKKLVKKVIGKNSQEKKEKEKEKSLTNTEIFNAASSSNSGGHTAFGGDRDERIPSSHPKKRGIGGTLPKRAVGNLPVFVAQSTEVGNDDTVPGFASNDNDQNAQETGKPSCAEVNPEDNEIAAETVFQFTEKAIDITALSSVDVSPNKSNSSADDTDGQSIVN